jgi:hypothetical protein
MPSRLRAASWRGHSEAHRYIPFQIRSEPTSTLTCDAECSQIKKS